MPKASSKRGKKNKRVAEETIQDGMVIGEAPEDTPMPDSQRSGLLSADQDERIAQFFEDHPFFYDKTLSDYRKQTQERRHSKEVCRRDWNWSWVNTDLWSIRYSINSKH